MITHKIKINKVSKKNTKNTKNTKYINNKKNTLI